MQLARDPETRLIEVADLRFRQAGADPGMDPLQVARLLANPRREARRARKRRAEQVAQRLGGAVFGDQLLDIEIDLSPQRRDQLFHVRRENHPYVNSHPNPPVSINPQPARTFPNL